MVVLQFFVYSFDLTSLLANEYTVFVMVALITIRREEFETLKYPIYRARRRRCMCLAGDASAPPAVSDVASGGSDRQWAARSVKHTSLHTTATRAVSIRCDVNA